MKKFLLYFMFILISTSAIAQDKLIVEMHPMLCNNKKVIHNNLIGLGYKQYLAMQFDIKGVTPLLKEGGVYILYINTKQEWALYLRPQIRPKVMCYMFSGENFMFLERALSKKDTE